MDTSKGNRGKGWRRKNQKQKDYSPSEGTNSYKRTNTLKIKRRQFEDVYSGLAIRVSIQNGNGSYKQWTDLRVENLSRDFIGQSYPASKIGYINCYNDFTILNGASKYGDKTFANGFISTAGELNSFDNSHRATMMPYTSKLINSGQKVDKESFSRIWIKRGYKERQKYLHHHLATYFTIWRAGVIPYVKIEKTYYYGFGHDATMIRKSSDDFAIKDLSDFGGGIEVGESAVMGAIREWGEETIYGFSDYVITPDTIVSFYHGVAIYFVDVTNQKPPNLGYGFDDGSFPGTVNRHLNNSTREKLEEWKINDRKPEDFPEISGMKWLTASEIKERIKNEGMNMTPIYDVIIPNISIIDHIEKLIALGQTCTK